MADMDDVILQRALRTCLKYAPADWTAERCLAETRRVLGGARLRKGLMNLRGQRARERQRGLGEVETLITRGFQDGKKSWITVKPPRGPKMRITHEVLGDFKISKDELRLRQLSDKLAKDIERKRRQAVAYVHPVYGRHVRSLRKGGRIYKETAPLPSRNVFGPPVLAGLDDLAGLDKRLTSGARKRLPAGKFALPGQRYPIQDCSHARNALSRASMSYHRGNLSKREYNTVVRKARAAVRRLCL